MSLESNISELRPWLQTYIDRLSPSERKKLMRKIAQNLAKANRQRMAKQQSPDGETWQERKPQRDAKSNRNKLFVKLRQAKSLRKRVQGNRIIVGFNGSAGRIARIHHYGLRERLQYGEADYPVRELIGIIDDDKKMTEQTILGHIEGD
ncbi:MAG: phage virion morphogenesis protein [Gammaproteobacteria bacterium]|nr:MAG: phage virion morphogenesis protein [Gammaproteobacteria bacterium]